MSDIALSPMVHAQSTGQRWSVHLLALGLAFVALVAFFIRDIADMATMWWSISTYQHALFVLPIIGWLIWERRNEVKALTPAAWWPGLFVLLGGSLLWTLGEAGGIALFRHAAIVFMAQALVLAVLGPTLLRALLFPVFYLVFLIPIGEELVPALQTLTAQLTIALLGLSAIPHQVDGVFITIPNGYFEVAEACSGVKFLIAMIAYGALVCNVCFRSWIRRAAFMAMCVVVPILANGVRAFATIWVAWAIDRDFAKGFDHIVYGWFFFALVILVIMAAGWRFFDRKIGDRWINDGRPDSRNGGSTLGIVLGGLAVMALPPLWQAGVAASGRIALPDPVALPDVRGWTRLPLDQRAQWAPRFAGADHFLHGAYRDARGNVVELAIAAFAWQAEGREIVGYGQGAIDPSSDWAWSADQAPLQGARVERIAGPGKVTREVASFYVIDEQVLTRDSAVKLATLKARLLGGDQSAVAILVSAEDRPERPARTAIMAFITAFGSPVQRARAIVDAARGRAPD